MALALSELTTVREQLYQELLAEHPSYSHDAIEAALQFMQVAAQNHLRNELLFQEFGLTSGRFHLLMLLRRAPGHALSPSALAEKVQVTRATMTQFVDALEKEGWVKRTENSTDRRATLISLTTRGQALLKKVLPRYLDRLTEFTRILNRSERKQLLQLMEKLNSAGEKK